MTTPGKSSSCSLAPFGHPLRPEHVALFTHPDPRLCWHRPAILPDSTVAASNGHVCLHVTGFTDTSGLDGATPKFIDRWHAAGWDRFQLPNDPAHWQPLDLAVPTLRRLARQLHPPGPFRLTSAGHHTLRRSPAVMLGTGYIVAADWLILLSRLPRAAVLCHGDHRYPVRGVFRGGRFLLSVLPAETTVRHRILSPRRHFDGKIEFLTQR